MFMTSYAQIKELNGIYALINYYLKDIEIFIQLNASKAWDSIRWFVICGKLIMELNFEFERYSPSYYGW